MSFLPNTPYFGKLSIKYTYVEYNGPRLFHASNRVGSDFIAFWIDSDEVSDSWLYAPVSKEKLHLLNNGEIKLRDLFIYPDDLVYRVKTFFDNEKLSIIEDAGALTDEILPPADYILVPPPQKAKSRIKKDIAELYIASVNQGKVSLDKLSRVTEAFNGVYKSIMSSLDLISSPMTPIDARTGSFIMRVKAPQVDKCLPVLAEIFEIFKKSRNPFNELRSLGLDFQVIEELLESVIDGNVKLKFGKEDSYSAELTISEEKAREILNKMQEESISWVSSSQVPQADNLMKVFEVVAIKAMGEVVTPEKIGVTTERQVSYYVHAAKTLGFLSNSNAIQSAGFQFSQLDKKNKLKVAAMRFESSECGWAWINWAEVKSICELEPSSAFEFLLERCPSLSPDTAKRRSKTLSSWVKELASCRH